MMAEINVTPFVDVMLVLLIVFMVTAPLLTVGVDVRLPKTQANALPVGAEAPITITLTGDGRTYVQETEVAKVTLVEHLREARHADPARRIFLRADGSIDYGTVVQVMGLLNRGGFTSLSLVTDVGGPVDLQPEAGASEG